LPPLRPLSGAERTNDASASTSVAIGGIEILGPPGIPA
jgi:hypothetical protein